MCVVPRIYLSKILKFLNGFLQSLGRNVFLWIVVHVTVSVNIVTILTCWLEINITIFFSGTFLLTNLLVDHMIASGKPSRIITVSSDAQMFTFSFNATEEWNTLREGFLSQYSIYCKSKSANILFSQELSKKLKGVYLIMFRDLKTI